MAKCAVCGKRAGFTNASTMTGPVCRKCLEKASGLRVDNTITALEVSEYIQNKSAKTLITNTDKKIKPSSNKLAVPNHFAQVHPDILDLLWIGDGKFANYKPSYNSAEYEYFGIPIKMGFSREEEPSLIFSSLPVKFSVNIEQVERPSYYPAYKELTPEQRGVYWNLLENPYNTNINVGYVFILYYGLERHLLRGDIDSAFNIILKLRDVHTNKSFQTYSAKAIILSSLLKQRPDLIIKFLGSLDHDFELTFTNNLLLLCKYSFEQPLEATDIMRAAKDFGFTNNNYIKKQPELFSETLNKQLRAKYSKDKLLINDFVSNSQFKKLAKENTTLYANLSIIDETLPVPLLISNKKFIANMYMLLQDTHEEVKRIITEKRKTGTLTKAPTIQPQKKNLLFDKFEEQCLLKELRNASNVGQKSLSYNELMRFYYKNREIDSKYLELCIEYCYKDIDILDAASKEYRKRQLESYERLKPYHNAKENEEDLCRANEPYVGGSAAYKRLCIIFEKNKDYNKAIEVCNQAIDYYNTLASKSKESFASHLADEFKKRKAKIFTKIT